MELKEKFVITFDREEAEALKIILGKLNDIQKKEMGLSENQNKQMSKLWSLLPYREEDE